MDFSVARAKQLEKPPSVCKQLFMEALQRYTKHNIIYADGTRTADGVSCAVLVIDNEHQLKALEVCKILSLL